MTPVALASYGYDVCQDIKEYDRWDAAKAVGITTFTNGASVAISYGIAGACAATGVGAPVAVVIVAGVGVSLFFDYIGDKAKNQ